MRVLPCLIVPCCVVFGCYLLETYSFLKGNGGRVDLGEKGGIREWEEWREGNCCWDAFYERKTHFQYKNIWLPELHPGPQTRESKCFKKLLECSRLSLGILRYEIIESKSNTHLILTKSI